MSSDKVARNLIKVGPRSVILSVQNHTQKSYISPLLFRVDVIGRLGEAPFSFTCTHRLSFVTTLNST